MPKQKRVIPHVTVMGTDGITRRVPEALTRKKSFKIQGMRIIADRKPERITTPVSNPVADTEPQEVKRGPGRPKNQTVTTDADQA